MKVHNNKLIINGKETTLTPEQLKELGFENKPWLQKGDRCWLLNPSGAVTDWRWDDDRVDQECLATGSVFPTKEAAEAELAKRKALQEIKTYIRDNFGEFEADWDHVDKWNHYVVYNHDLKKFKTNMGCISQPYSPFGYLASRDHTEQLIRDQEANLKILWGVE